MAKILLADKDSSSRSRTLEAISSLGNNKVICVSDGLKALAQIYSERFDLIIVDAETPYLNGVNLLKASQKNHPQCPVIMTIRDDDFEVAQNAVHLGAFDILKQPGDITEIKNTISAGLEESRQMKSSGYAYRDQNRNNTALIKKGIMAAFGDSIFAGLGLFLAFTLGAVIDNRIPLRGIAEPLLVGLGLAFCYAFVFVLNRSHRLDFISSRSGQALRLFRDLSTAYALQLCIMFFAREESFQLSREVIILGFAMGFVALAINRFLFLPALGFITVREGKRKIVFKSLATQDIGTVDPQRSSTSRLVSSPEDYKTLESDSKIAEIFISKASLEPSRIVSLMERFRGEELKISVVDDSPKSKPAQPVSP